MNVSDLLSFHPQLHQDEHGEPISWAIGDDVLRFISDHAVEGSRTMETGAGMSTIVFANSRSAHTAIAPSSDEFNKIRAFCRIHDIDLSQTNLVEGYSETVLPGLINTCQLDLFLVDGRHAFPSPYIDWYYGARMLRVGGIMVVDDTQLLTGAVLRDFMTEDDFWEIVVDFSKTTVFRKIRDGFESVEWNQQPYIMSRQ